MYMYIYIYVYVYVCILYISVYMLQRRIRKLELVKTKIS